jgi:tRNA A37 N6-isopentenylltransferase MiaA
MFFRIWLVGLMVLMVNGVNAQREGFSASISGKVTNSGDYGVSGAEVQIFYYTLDESNGLTSPEKISGREPIKTFKTNEDGSFGGALTMDDAIEKIKQHSRNYAKRQETWLKRYNDLIRLNPISSESLLEQSLTILAKTETEIKK